MAVRRPVALFSPIATLCVATAVACLWATTVSCSTSGSNRKAVANGVVEKWEVFNPKPKEVILALAGREERSNAKRKREREHVCALKAARSEDDAPLTSLVLIN